MFETLILTMLVALGVPILLLWAVVSAATKKSAPRDAGEAAPGEPAALPTPHAVVSAPTPTVKERVVGVILTSVLKAGFGLLTGGGHHHHHRRHH